MIENWIETSSGEKVQFLEPKPEQIKIKDIAHSLANQCRYNGHCHGFFSVAEHSVNVAMQLPDELKLTGLLHDASEAYLSDIPSPVKQFLPDYQIIETRLEEVIAQKFGLTYPYPTEVKLADIAALSTEANYLLKSQGDDWLIWEHFGGRPPINNKYKPQCLPPIYAYNVFLAYYYKLVPEERPSGIILESSAGVV
ncbi:MAG: hypothetical protein KGI54_14810 [Pseudomonadota bacterium]|nr:hypothetical protein [Pseudomonadota bacterium]